MCFLEIIQLLQYTTFEEPCTQFSSILTEHKHFSMFIEKKIRNIQMLINSLK